MALSKKDAEQRLRFVKTWVGYVKRTPNAKWSREQNLLINSVMKTASQDLKRYLKVKRRASKQ